MIFKDIDMDAREELNPYFDLVDYEACEYCFTTLYMWQHVYKTGYAQHRLEIIFRFQEERDVLEAVYHEMEGGEPQ